MKKILFIILFFICSQSLIAATITVQADFNPVLLSDSFHLISEANGSVDDDPDFSPLEKDFEILNRNQSSNISIINGNYNRSKKWTLSVMAKRAGVFTLPAISFGSDTSPQMLLTVKAVSHKNSKSYDLNKKQVLELETSSESVWVQGQVIVTLRLLTSENINSFRFSEFKITDMDVVSEQLGKEKQYKTYRGNTPYLVVERRYALFPQQTGVINVNPMVAEVDVPSGRRSNSFFDPFGRNIKTRRVRSAALKIQVKDIPKKFNARHWLPAKDIQLVEEWPDKIQFKVGEPVTRTLSLLADGLTSAQLPELSLNSIAGLKQYPDQAKLHDTKNDDGIVGIREEKLALIPTQAGSYTLPAIEVPWWNTQTSQMEVARIAEKHIQVLADAQQNLAAGNIQKPIPTTTPVLPAQTNATNELRLVESSPAATPVNNFWFYISLLLGALWLITLLFCGWYCRHRSSLKKINTEKSQSSVSLNSALKMLKKACQNNDAAACKNALIIWAQVSLQQSNINNLGELAGYFDEPLSTKINRLNEHLYAAKKHTWQADGLFDLCQQYRPKQKSASSGSNQLEPLYKA